MRKPFTVEISRTVTVVHYSRTLVWADTPEDAKALAQQRAEAASKPGGPPIVAVPDDGTWSEWEAQAPEPCEDIDDCDFEFDAIGEPTDAELEAAYAAQAEESQ